MKTIFDKDLRAELIDRVKSINENSKAQWGKMNVYQMTKHCTFWNDWILGRTELKYKQAFIGFLFGKMALKSMVNDDSPLKKNMPAGRAFNVKETHGDIELQKSLWIKQIPEFGNFSNPDFIHGFFGKMAKEEIGILVYKHSDHHLRQFHC